MRTVCTEEHCYAAGSGDHQLRYTRNSRERICRLSLTWISWNVEMMSMFVQSSFRRGIKIAIQTLLLTHAQMTI